MDHELQPRPGEVVDRRRGNELVAREQLARHDARVGLHDRRFRLRPRARDRDVAPEASVGTAHRRVVEVVVAAVVGAPRQVRRLERGQRPLVDRRRVVGVVEVRLAQDVADAGEHGETRHDRQRVPSAALVDALRDAMKDPPEPRVAVLGLRRGRRVSATPEQRVGYDDQGKEGGELGDPHPAHVHRSLRCDRVFMVATATCRSACTRRRSARPSPRGRGSGARRSSRAGSRRR